MKPTCPICLGTMIKRYRKLDNHAFYGCKKYPKCTGTREIGQETAVSDIEEFIYEEYIRDMGDR